MKRLAFIFLWSLAAVLSARSQTILGKSPLDKVLAPFFGSTNGNADIVIDGINAHGTHGLNGSKLADNSINSNKLDAATRAMLGGSGGTGGTATNAFLSQVSGPGITLVTNGSGFNYTFSLTLALQLWSAFTPTSYSNALNLGSAAHTDSTAYDAANAARNATNGYPWSPLYDAVNSARNATNGYPWSTLYDSANTAHDATNGYPWGALYDAANAGTAAATAATNGIAAREIAVATSATNGIAARENALALSTTNNYTGAGGLARSNGPTMNNLNVQGNTFIGSGAYLSASGTGVKDNIFGTDNGNIGVLAFEIGSSATLLDNIIFGSGTFTNTAGGDTLMKNNLMLVTGATLNHTNQSLGGDAWFLNNLAAGKNLTFICTNGATENFFSQMLIVGENIKAIAYGEAEENDSVLLGKDVTQRTNHVFQANFLNGYDLFGGPIKGLSSLTNKSDLTTGGTNDLASRKEVTQIVGGMGLAGTNQLLPLSTVSTNQYAFFDGTGGGTNLGSTLNGQWWTNMDVHFTNYGATTNIVLPADGNSWRVLATNGPHLFFSFGGNNTGPISIWITTNGDAALPPQVTYLGYSDTHTTNCIIDLQPWGGTNRVLAAKSEL